MGSNTTISIDAYDYPVNSVVVFRQQAEVTRVFPVQLKTGSNELEISNLPTSMLFDSLRVDGMGKGVTVVDHSTRSRVAPVQSLFGQTRQESKRMKELKAMKKATEGQLEILRAQGNVVLEYAKSMTAEHVQPIDFAAFVSKFRDTGFATVEAIREKEKEVDEIDTQIQEERDMPENAENQQNERKTRVSVVMKTDADVNAELKLTYVVTAASWQPNYDIRATTDSSGEISKTVAVHYRASVQQTSGEDWRNTSITLSTNQPLFKQAIPAHKGLKIVPQGVTGGLFGSTASAGGGLFGQPQQQQQQQLQQQQQQQQQRASQQQQMMAPQPHLFGGTNALPPQGSAFSFGSAPQAPPGGSTLSYAPQPDATEDEWTSLPRPATAGLPPAADEPFSFASAVAETNALNATYKIDGKVTIPSDRTNHKVVISLSNVLPVDTFVVTMPRAQPVAHLQARIKNTTKETLLAGQAMLFNDESYVGSCWIPLTASKESFTCSLGVDQKVQVGFAHVRDKPVTSNLVFAGNTETHTCTNIIKIKNSRGSAIPKVVVRDAVPVGQEPFKIILKDPEELGLATDREAEVKIGASGKITARWTREKATAREEGLIEWILKDVEPGKETKIELKWQVQSPLGTKWAHAHAPA